MSRITPEETQVAAVAYDAARMRLWDLAVDRALGGWRWPGLRGWVRTHDLGMRKSALIAETAEERALLAEARRQRGRATDGCLGLAVAFARAHRGAGQDMGGRGLVLVAPGDDALQAALEQVLVGLDRYDPAHRNAAGRSCKASTYIAWWCYKGVQDERWRAAGARLTQSALAHWSAVEDAERLLRQALGREPTWDEVVAELDRGGHNGERTAAVARRVSQVLRAGSLSAATSEDDEAPARERPCPDPLPDEAIERAELRARIDAAAPPGSRRRIVAEALALDGVRGAARAAGSRAEAEVCVAEVRAALEQEVKP